MIGTLKRYLKHDLGPRWKDVVTSSHVFIAIIVGIVFSLLSQNARWAPGIEAHVFMTAILTYASIAFGFSITGASVSLALPQDFVRLLHCNRDKSGNCMFGNLIFVFSWTGTIHVFLVVFAIVGFFLYGDDAPLFTLTREWRNIFASVLVGLSLYCVIQFMITIAVISGVGRIYSSSLDSPDPEDENE